MTEEDKFWMLPEDFQNEYAQLAANFVLKTGASTEEVVDLICKVLKIYFKYTAQEEIIN